MKWLWIVPVAVIGLLLALWIGGKVYFALVTNEKVARELREVPDGERAARVMLLTFPDGRELPVNYLREGNQVFAGADGRWWRAFESAHQGRGALGARTNGAGRPRVHARCF